MPRSARIVIPGAAHHVTHRGNNRAVVFAAEHDYAYYYRLLVKYSRLASMRILGYCLMPNHVHLIVVPPAEDTFELVFRETQRRYTSFFNRQYDRSGHVWQNRFFSCPMDEPHTLNALAYVELNPVRAGMVLAAGEFPWSSGPAHVARDTPDPLLNLERWYGYWTEDEWRAKLTQIAEDRGFTEKFKECTSRGEPLGGEEFKRKVWDEIRVRRGRKI